MGTGTGAMVNLGAGRTWGLCLMGIIYTYQVTAMESGDGMEMMRVLTTQSFLKLVIDYL